jgi:hypothetical protein
MTTSKEYTSRTPAKFKSPSPLLIEREGHLIIQIPLEIKRRANRKTIIPPVGWREPDVTLEKTAAPRTTVVTTNTSPISPRINLPLATAIARGFLWLDLIESGEYPTVAALADDLEIDRAYVARHVRMTLLSPGLVRKILRGDEPEGLTMGRLRGSLAMDWEAQERDLGVM